jgi:hypothetical protein
MNEEAFIQGFVKAAYEGASRLELHYFCTGHADSWIARKKRRSEKPRKSHPKDSYVQCADH